MMYTPRRILRALRWLAMGTAPQRRRVRHELARIAASLFGDFPISDDYKRWREDRAFLADFRRLSPGNLFTEDRKFMLREFVRFTDGLPGALAECGCFEGASAYFMAQAAPDTDLYLFDSLAGLSEPGVADAAADAEHMRWRAGDMSAREAVLRGNLAGFTRIQLLRGWIPERFGDVAQQRFRCVHIDVDLYQPTRDSLEFFYPRMVPGGVIVLDDYGSAMCPGAVAATDEFFADKPERVIHLTSGQGVVIRRQLVAQP